jgi:hypothetical protein
VAKAFTSKFSLDYSSIQVSKHSPTDFLVTIFDCDTFEEAAAQNSFPFSGRDFCLCRWSPRDNGNWAAMRFYVRLGLEGIPLHLWTESFATRVIGRTCSLHFAEEHSRCREATNVFELLAWTADPCAIPLRVWLTVIDPDTSVDVPQVQVHWQRPVKPKRGMVYDVLVHLLSIEDTRKHRADGRLLFYSFHPTM